MKKGTITLKIMGVLVSIGGFCAYLLSMASRTISYSAYVVGSLCDGTSTSKELVNAVNNYSHSVYWLIIITMSIILVYELVNYLLYLFNKRKALLIAIVVEIIACIVLTILRLKGIVHFQTLAMTIPIITGLINVIILKINAK